MMNYLIISDIIKGLFLSRKNIESLYVYNVALLIKKRKQKISYMRKYYFDNDL